MPQVEIRIQGHIDKQWATWLSDFTITHTERDTSTLRGSVADQAALYGLIAKLRDMGLNLISVNLKEDIPGEAQGG